MISSRVQFGVYGAIIPIVLVCLMYVGFSAPRHGAVGSGDRTVDQVGDSYRHPDLRRVIVVLTVLGYRVIHVVGRVSSVVGVIALRLSVRRPADPERYRRAAGTTAISAGIVPAGDVAVGVVADRLRPLCGRLLALPAERHSVAGRPSSRSARASVLGAQISMVFGVFAAALAGAFRGHEVAYHRRPGRTGDGRRAAVLQR